MTEPLIITEGLQFKRGDRMIFDGVDLEIPRGKITAIMGPSGSGKTTLLKIIGGELKPWKGEVIVEGKNVHRLKRRELLNLRQKMGILFQSGALFTDLSVFDNVAFPLREHTRLPEILIRDLVLMKLEAVGLRGARDLMPRELSGGMARRVALARAIALDPQFVLYDEPFTGQDPISMGVLIKLIRLLNETLGLTSIIVSHDVLETASIAHKIYVLAEGKVVSGGSPEALQKSTSPELQQFLKGMPDGPVPFHYPARPFVEELMLDTQRSVIPMF
ncbi:MAG: ABC transporter ATP-binding protein [Gammaproteobacteria bacterium]|nr:ABC transporter ATP-binding protein [Gammaproteobacteria bacterium]